jgi:HD-GYP domain-containing protein (c-di-GMP phosphodiesterase class II)
MARTRVPIYQLQIGMYVAKLDLSWFRSPFLRHSFLIEHTSQIEKLVRAGVKTVEIDLDRGIAAQLVKTSAAVASGIEPLCGQVSTAPSKRTKSLAQLNEEYAQAKLAKKQLDQAVQSVFSTFTKTGTVNPQQAAEAVQEITIVTRTLTNSAIFMALSQNRAGDSALSQHALTTCTLSLVLGQAFKFNPLELQELATAALLHDIGLLQIPPPIVLRSHITSSPLPQHEQQQFHAHPRLSVLTLERQGGIESAVLHLIGDHHAYLDGSGYPRETRGEFTSDRTRILMIVDTYDELITGFGGALPLAPHQALQRLYQEAQQGKLDQNILSHFIKVVGIYPVHSHVRLNTNEVAMVTDLNPTRLHQPVVTITHESEGAAYPTPFIVNLAHQEDQPQERAIQAIIDDMPASLPSHSSRAA